MTTNPIQIEEKSRITQEEVSAICAGAKTPTATGTILAVDVATHCGWAIMLPSEHVMSGTWNLSVLRGEGGGMRFVRFRTYLTRLLAMQHIDRVYYEKVEQRHASKAAAEVYGGLIAILTAVCEEHEPPIPYAGIPVATIKKCATGKGVASKEAMIAAAKARWPGYTSNDDNEADARWIGVTARELEQ